MSSFLQVLIPCLVVLLFLACDLMPDARFTRRFPFVTTLVLPDAHDCRRVGWARGVIVALALLVAAVLLCLLII